MKPRLPLQKDEHCPSRSRRAFETAALSTLATSVSYTGQHRVAAGQGSCRMVPKVDR